MSIQPTKQTRKCDSGFDQQFPYQQLSTQSQTGFTDSLGSCSSKEHESLMQAFQSLKASFADAKYKAKVSKVSDTAEPVFVSIGSDHKRIRIELLKVDVTKVPSFEDVFSSNHLLAMRSGKTGSKYLEQREPTSYIDKAVRVLGAQHPNVVVQHIAKSSTREILWDSDLKIVAILKSGKWRFYDLTTGETLAEIKTYALPALQHFV